MFWKLIILWPQKASKSSIENLAALYSVYKIFSLFGIFFRDAAVALWRKVSKVTKCHIIRLASGVSICHAPPPERNSPLGKKI
jgi:hypothetical protein